MQWRYDIGHRNDGTRGRKRPAGHAHHRHEGRRPLHHQRVQDLHHERLVVRPGHRVRQDGPQQGGQGHLALLRGDLHPWVQEGEEAAEDGDEGGERV